MQERYMRNIPAISEEEQILLGKKRVLIVGCGGLGGYLIENLLRLGVGEITAVDADVFEPSNLNRQLLSTLPGLGRSKAQAARERAGSVNPAVTVHAVQTLFDADNADMLVTGQDLVLDALDNVPARLILEDACGRQSIPIVHGAVLRWSAQIAVVPPGSGLLHRLYSGMGVPQEKCVLPFAPPFCAAVQTAEAVKLLCGRQSELAGKVLMVDLRRLSWDIIELGQTAPEP